MTDKYNRDSIRSLVDMTDLEDVEPAAGLSERALEPMSEEDERLAERRFVIAFAAGQLHGDKHCREWLLRQFAAAVLQGHFPCSALTKWFASRFIRYMNRADTKLTLDSFLFRRRRTGSRMYRSTRVRDFMCAAYVHRRTTKDGITREAAMREVAGATEWSRSTIESAIRRARQQLLACLAGNEKHLDAQLDGADYRYDMLFFRAMSDPGILDAVDLVDLPRKR